MAMLRRMFTIISWQMRRSLSKLIQQQKIGYAFWFLVSQTYELLMWSITSASGSLHILQPIDNWNAEWSKSKITNSDNSKHPIKPAKPYKNQLKTLKERFYI